MKPFKNNIPMLLNFIKRILKLTVSNAFGTSRNIPRKYFSSSKSVVILTTVDL